MENIFKELKEILLSRVSRRIGDISKRHGGELTKEDLEDLKSQIDYYEKIEKFF